MSYLTDADGLQPLVATGEVRQPTAVGAQRRLRALAARGWSQRAIQQEAGIPAAQTARGLGAYGTISPGLARDVAAIYEQLWDRRPPAECPSDREDAEKTSARADACGWAPPMAWDDDQSDLPDGRPAPAWKPGTRTTRRSVDVVEDADFLRRYGGYRSASQTQVAKRICVSRDQLAHAYMRVRAYAARQSDERVAAEAEAEAEAG